MTCLPSLGLPPLSEPSLGLSVAPIGIVLLVDVSRMLAIVFELPPQDISLALRIAPPGGHVVLVSCMVLHVTPHSSQRMTRWFYRSYQIWSHILGALSLYNSWVSYGLTDMRHSESLQKSSKPAAQQPSPVAKPEGYTCC